MVAMIGITLPLVIISPTSDPHKVPTRIPMIKARKVGIPGLAFSINATDIPENAIVDPMEISMPPINKTHIIPTTNILIITAFVIKSLILVIDINVLFLA